MTVFELMNILKEYPAGSKVVIDKWDQRNEITRLYKVTEATISCSSDNRTSDDDVIISMGDEIK